MTQNKRLTEAEIARLVGVSHMTVSRVLNNYPYIKKTTRQKVLAACHKFNYRPNLIAATLRNKKSRAIGVVVPTFKHAYYARFLDTVQQRLQKEGYHIIVLQCRHKNTLPFLSSEDFDFLLARQIQGLLLNFAPDKYIISYLKRERLPVIFIDIPSGDKSFSSVGTADFKSAKDLTLYLIKSGHHQILFLSGQKHLYTSERRLAGYRAAFAESQLKLNEDFIFYTNYHFDGGFRAVRKLLKNPKISFTAIIGANDYVAIGAMSALSKAGVKVPEEVSVAAFTGDEIGAYVVPSLTTMVQPIEEIGCKAVEILLACLQNPQRPVDHILLPAKFLKRESTKPLKAKL